MELNQEWMEGIYLNMEVSTRCRCRRARQSGAWFTAFVPGYALHYGSESTRKWI